MFQLLQQFKKGLRSWRTESNFLQITSKNIAIFQVAERYHNKTAEGYNDLLLPLPPPKKCSTKL